MAATKVSLLMFFIIVVLLVLCFCLYLPSLTQHYSGAVGSKYYVSRANIARKGIKATLRREKTGR
jgi:hypothetical protein